MTRAILSALALASLFAARDALALTRPDRAVAMALADARAVAAESGAAVLTQRYVMAHTADDETRAALALAVNTALLHGAEPWRPAAVGDGTVWRVDLAELTAHDADKLALMLDTWDRMSDPQFYASSDQTKQILAPPFIHDGTRWTRATLRVLVPLAHADPGGQLSELATLTNSLAPIVSLGQFLRQALNSDLGGLYPEFRQFDLAPEKGTAEEAFLRRGGVILDDLATRNADQRVVLMSRITGQPRTVEYAPTAATRPSVGPTIATITRDYFAGAIQAGAHPFENLAGRKHDGTEIFLPTAEGGMEFALFNGAGGFVRSAPLNPPGSLAADRTVPPPSPPVLQGPSSCLRCHITTNADTKLLGPFQAAPNWVTWLAETRVGMWQFDVFAEAGDSGAGRKRLVNLFSGETNEAFSYAGRTYAKFVFTACGKPLEEAIAGMMRVHDAWVYAKVDPSFALRTLGYDEGDNARAVALFNTICPPTGAEPLRLSLVRAWREDRPVAITIDDWLAVYAEVALRVAAWEAEQTAKQAEQPAAD